MSLPPWLEEQIRDGEAILFLGAGTVKGAIGPKGEQPLTGCELRDQLSKKFLGGSQAEKPLSQVAEFAKYQASLHVVQRFVSDLLEPLGPAEFHLLIPKFRWHAIVTTNYDFVLERAYRKANEPIQKLKPIIRNGDRFTEAIGDRQNVPYLKLHGCLSEINDDGLPLILASEEYARHKNNRDRLFTHFEDWAREHPVIFCGYDLSDPNIQQIMFDLGDKTIHRQQFAIVSPSLDEISKNYWSSRRVHPIQESFEDFICQLDAKIPRHTRQLSGLRSINVSSIQPWVQGSSPSDSLKQYLDSGLQHVYGSMSTKGVKPVDFYSGAGNEWGAIKSSLDIERRVTDDVLLEAVLDASEGPILDLFLLKGYAGSGKSIALRRTAWNASVNLQKLVFWLDEGSFIRPDLFGELCRITKERIYLFLDDVLPHFKDIKLLLERAKNQRLPITIVFAARTNEWNVAVAEDSIEEFISKEFELDRLFEPEISKLLYLLEKHECLGELKYLQRDERRKFFRLTADKQLLVALHEATSGKSFSDIVIDEYENIYPEEAKLLYQDVCTLHRFRVGVRAGLLSRVSGITFNYFNRYLFSPLEHVIFVYFDTASRDNAYRTRHSIIADIVFREILREPEKRANQIVRIIACMNVDYTSDQTAFEQLIRGRELAELFADRMYADRIFEAAKMAQASRAHIEHQRAVFELNHSAGNVRSAIKSIKEAEKILGKKTNSLKHTHATALRKLAVESISELEREKYRTEAKKILKNLISRQDTSHGLYTLAQILCDELSEKLATPSGKDEDNQQLNKRIISELTSQLDELFHKGKQLFPGESFMLELESKYAKVVQDAPRAHDALVRAHSVNPENGFLAVRLSQYYEIVGDKNKARSVLVQCIEKNPSCKPAHLELAKLLIKENEDMNHKEIFSRLNSSFTEGDTNYDAQYWCARHEYLFGDRARAERIFKSLSRSRIRPQYKLNIRGYVVDNSGNKKLFEGMIKTKSDSYCFIESTEFRTELFSHYSDSSEHDIADIEIGSRVIFHLGFNLKGPSCSDVQIEN